MSTNALSTIFQSGSLMPVDEETLAVAGSGQSSKRISIKGGVFRLIVNGKEVSTNEDRSMNVVIVKMSPDASRTYYEGAYKEGEKVSPVCWSSDSRKPDASVKTPIASSCAECPNSIKGSGQGGNGTACRLSWRAAVVLANSIEGDVYQLVLPATSSFGKEDNGRWPFRPYVQMLAANNVAAGGVVTKMQFDTKSPTPRLLFSPVSPVDRDLWEAVRNQGKTPAAENAIKMTVSQTDRVPQLTSTPQTEDDSTDEVAPVKQTRKKAAAAPVEDTSDLIKKWADM
jgi:hypothetical protein